MSSRGEKLNGQRRFEAMAKNTKAALEVFAEYGYHEATMEHIMKDSGLCNGLVHHYFPSKGFLPLIICFEESSFKNKR